MTTNRRPKQKFKTCRRYNTPGDAHSLTFNCFHAQAFLSKDRTRLWLIDALCAARKRLDAQARQLERSASGPSVEALIAEERCASPAFGGRSVFGWERAEEGGAAPSARADA